MPSKHKSISPKKKLENSLKKAKASLLALKALIDMLEEGLTHKSNEQLRFDFADENELKKAREEMTSAIDIYIREAKNAYTALSNGPVMTKSQFCKTAAHGVETKDTSQLKLST